MSNATSLKKLYQGLEANVSNLPLAEQAVDIVPGEGNPEAEILCIGEAPGAMEAIERRPFVGRSGQLFRRTLREVGIEEKSVYITNVVKVRPPDNRDPLPAEVAAFKPCLSQEIAIIKPLLIVTLGRFSMNTFLPTAKISQIHGRLHTLHWSDQKLFVLPMYHPAAALRGTTVKDLFVADFQKIPAILRWLHDQAGERHFEQEVIQNLM